MIETLYRSSHRVRCNDNLLLLTLPRSKNLATLEAISQDSQLTLGLLLLTSVLKNIRLVLLGCKMTTASHKMKDKDYWYHS